MCLFDWFITLSLYFPTLFPPQTTLFHPFPVFGSSPKYDIVSLVQFQDPFPLHPITNLTPLQEASTLKVA